jgi:hypothetical protein
VGNTAEKVADKGLLLRDTISGIAAVTAAVGNASDPAGGGIDAARRAWRHGCELAGVHYGYW